MTDSNRLELNKNFVNVTLGAIVTTMLGVGAYMIAWNRDDQSWKTLMDERMLNMVQRISKIEDAIDKDNVRESADASALQESKWRLNGLERRVDELEDEHDAFDNGK